jgi:hypothetical protein
MFGAGSTTFFGFTNTTAPSNNSDVEKYLDYFSLSGGTGGVPSIVTQTIPQIGGGTDSEGNTIVQYNFLTTEINSGTISGNAWYTWVIPDESIGGLLSNNRQTSIDLSFGAGPTTFTVKNTASSVYTYFVTNPGGSFANGRYRLYTTYVDASFYLNNSSTTIYFKGNTVV